MHLPNHSSIAALVNAISSFFINQKLCHSLFLPLWITVTCVEDQIPTSLVKDFIDILKHQGHLQSTYRSLKVPSLQLQVCARLPFFEETLPQ